MKKKSIFKYSIFNEVRKVFLLNKFKRRWSKNNPNNDTIPNIIFDEKTVEIGDYSYGELNIVSFDNKSKLIVGKYVSIAQNVTFLLDVEHHTNHLMTYPFKAKILLENEPETFSKGNIVIGDDIWVGYGTTIMSGVYIGQGAVIAAGSVVTKDVPPYAVVGGVPAKLIKYRFDREIIDKLVNITFKTLDVDQIKENIPKLYSSLKLNDINEILTAIEFDNLR